MAVISLDPERRRRWAAQAQHLAHASIGFEYFAAWVFAVYGVLLLWLPIQPSPNPALAWLNARPFVTGPCLFLIGVIHLGALFSWPHTDRRHIALRKAGTFCEWLFFVTFLAAGLVQFQRGQGGIFAPLLFLPLSLFLFVALNRRLYRDW